MSAGMCACEHVRSVTRRRPGQPQKMDHDDCRQAVAQAAAGGPRRPLWIASSAAGTACPKRPGGFPLVSCGGMSAQPVHEPDPDDPVEILRVLPERFHDQFLAEYYEAAGRSR